MSDSDIMTEMLILSEKLAKKGLQTCDVCGQHFERDGSWDHMSCSTCVIEDSNSKPALKLFKVTVFVLRPDDDTKGVDMMILDVDGPSAERTVLSMVGNVHPTKMVETHEMEGPFRAGQILLTSEWK